MCSVTDGVTDAPRIVSDDAGQFNVGRHALCWVHAERLVHKLDTFTDEQRSAQEGIRAAIIDKGSTPETTRSLELL